MEENKDYHAYRYGDHLTPGSELKIEHSVVCENVDISTLITMGTDSLEAMRQGSIDGEQKAYEIVVAAAKQWEQQAAATQTINRALEYLRTPEIEHTGNQWKDTDNWRADQKISNRVYQMTCSIWEDTKYDRETKQSVPIWTRSNAEVCLLATRGRPKRQCAGIHQFVISHIEQHSKKPDEVRDKIVKLMGDQPRVELFARQKTPGWDVWGNEVNCTLTMPERKG